MPLLLSPSLIYVFDGDPNANIFNVRGTCQEPVAGLRYVYTNTEMEGIALSTCPRFKPVFTYGPKEGPPKGRLHCLPPLPTLRP